MIAQSNLRQANSDLELRLQRLSTGLRINRGADDPAGLIVANRLRTELNGIEQSIKNSERAANVIATTEGSLDEVSQLLNSIKSLVVESANTGAFSPDEIKANQLQIDSAIESITRIANTASFAGLKVLNGSLGYRTSGINTAEIVKSRIFGVNFGDRGSVDVDVEVLASAQHSNLFLRSDWSAVGGTDGLIPSTVTLEIAGPEGVQELTFISGTAIDDVISAINSVQSITGVNASRVSATDVSSGLVITSADYGSEAFTSVRRLSGGTDLSFARLLNDDPGPIDWVSGSGTQWTVAESDEGRDVEVLINGALASGRGLAVTLRNPDLDIEMLLDDVFATTVDGTPESFVITGGGARYQLGPDVVAQQQVNIGIDSVAATRLGGSFVTLTDGTQALQFLSSLKAGGFNNLTVGNLNNASKILDTAIDEISQLRGRLGAFERNVLDTNVRSLSISLENITAAESSIRDADFAAETSALTRAQVLTQTSTSVLATANQQAQSVLQLLG
jgi:flagellin